MKKVKNIVQTYGFKSAEVSAKTSDHIF